jgi:hypothetical protein
MEKMIKEILKKAFVKQSEEFDGEAVYFAVINEDTQTVSSVCKVSKTEDSNWTEDVIAGEEPYGFGGKTYQSYLEPSDIMSWIRKDYARGDDDVIVINDQQELDDYINDISNKE